MNELCSQYIQTNTTLHYINFIGVAVFGFLALGLFFKSQNERHGYPKKCNVLNILSKVSLAMVIVWIVGVHFIGEKILNDQLSSIRLSTETEYSLEIQSPNEYFSKAVLNNSNFREHPLEAKATGDSSKSRIYEVYLVGENNSEFKYYTKNEKGVYLPITNASAKALSQDTAVIEENSSETESQE